MCSLVMQSCLPKIQETYETAKKKQGPRAQGPNLQPFQLLSCSILQNISVWRPFEGRDSYNLSMQKTSKHKENTINESKNKIQQAQTQRVRWVQEMGSTSNTSRVIPFVSAHSPSFALVSFAKPKSSRSPSISHTPVSALK